MPVAAKAAERANESRLKRPKPEQKLETAGMMRWLLTYADMITLLLALFIILFSISTINKVKYQALVRDISGGFNNQWAINQPPNGGISGLQNGQPLQQIQRQLERYIQSNKLQGRVQTHFDRQDLVISLLSNDAFYSTGSAQLRPAAQKILNRIAPLLEKTNADIQIHGHTDDVPISTPQYPSNWELSAARAVAVARYLAEVDGVDPNRLSATGFGQYRPGHPNDNTADRQLNRRVDIVLHPAGSEY